MWLGDSRKWSQRGHLDWVGLAKSLSKPAEQFCSMLQIKA
jgi:hypothetical protein